jgi:hypothetical protein
VPIHPRPSYSDVVGLVLLLRSFALTLLLRFEMGRVRNRWVGRGGTQATELPSDIIVGLFVWWILIGGCIICLGDVVQEDQADLMVEIVGLLFVFYHCCCCLFGPFEVIEMTLRLKNNPDHSRLIYYLTYNNNACGSTVEVYSSYRHEIEDDDVVFVVA